MAPTELVLITIVVLATAALSAAVGYGGGILLMAVLGSVLDPLTAIAVHGAIQLAGNATRARAHSGSIEWPVVARITALVIPGSIAGLAVARDLDGGTARFFMGAFVLGVTWWPRLSAGLSRRVGTPTLLAVGALTGFGNTTVGATGPVSVPFFRAATPTRLAFVGTFAVSQALGHLVKLVAVTGWTGARLEGHLVLIALGLAAVVAGTWVGTSLLTRFSEESFSRIQRVALTLLGLRLVGEALV